MKRIATVFFLYILMSSSAFALDDVQVFSNKNKFGLKNSQGVEIVPAIYKKIIRLGDNAYIIQKGSKFGLMSNNGEMLLKPKYRHVERLYGKYLKIGNDNNFGLYDEFGNAIIQPEFSRIEPLFYQMYLTCKDYKFGIVDYDGKTILENEFEDIYMPDKDTLRVKYNGQWVEAQKVSNNSIVLPQNSQKVIIGDEQIKITKIISDTGINSAYGALTLTDYFLKLFSSVSPAYEQTIDELMLSQGAETVSIFIKLGWLPKFPYTYLKKYYQNIRTPNNGPLADIRQDIKNKTAP